MKHNNSVVSFFRVCRFFLPMLLLWALSGCSTMRAISVIKRGAPIQLGRDIVVNASKQAHFLAVKVQVNGKAKKYNFLIDTGSLTLISEDVARELNLEDFIHVECNDSAGNKKEVSLVQLEEINVGGVIVNGCGAVIVNAEPFGNGIDGLLGSNFLQYFIVQLDYQSYKLNFLANPYFYRTTNTITIPFYKNIKYGFSPTGECQIDGDMTLECMVDTGHPEIVTVPVSSFQNLPQFKTKKFVESNGVMTSGIFGADDKSYLTRINKLTVGNLEISDIPATSNRFSEEIMTLGVGLLSKYLVTIDYPGSTLYLEPLPDSDIVKTYETFGLSVDKRKDTVLVRGVWNGSSAQKEGLSVGDVLYSIDSKNINDLSLLDIVEIMKSKDEIDLLYLNNRTNTSKVVTPRES